MTQALHSRVMQLVGSLTPMYEVTKTYGHEMGLSCCFRQWRAESHCRFMHGYALSVVMTFEADTLDARNWVMDFGGLKSVKQFLIDTFDHKTLVAKDDPHLVAFDHLRMRGLIDLVFVDDTGCEAFAKLIFDQINLQIAVGALKTDARLVKVEVKEHAGNAAAYKV